MVKMRCPQCGSTDKFFVEAHANVEVGSTGCVEDHDGFMWDMNAPCTCAECYHEGLFEDFAQQKED